MAILVNVDRVDTLELTEVLGVVRHMVRRYRIVWGAGNIPPPSYQVLEAAKALCPPALSGPLEYPYLTLVRRHAFLAEKEPTVVDVDLTYEHILDGPNQNLSAPSGGVLYGKGKCSIVEKTTNFFYPFGDTTVPRVQLQTAHTYGLQDVGRISQGFVPGLPRTIIQGGEIKQPYPQANFVISGLLYTINPFGIASLFIAGVNSQIWLNQVPFVWICSTVDWEILDTTTFLYRFNFEFQSNSDTWYPTVVFNDEHTGRPPATVEPATIPNFYGPGGKYTIFNETNNPVNQQFQPAGYWVVPNLRPIDFATLFSAYFEGFSTPPVS